MGCELVIALTSKSSGLGPAFPLTLQSQPGKLRVRCVWRHRIHRKSIRLKTKNGKKKVHILIREGKPSSCIVCGKEIQAKEKIPEDSSRLHWKGPRSGLKTGKKGSATIKKEKTYERIIFHFMGSAGNCPASPRFQALGRMDN